MKPIKFEPISETSLLMSFDPIIDDEILNHICNTVDILTKTTNPWLFEIIPSFNTILIQFDPLEMDHAQITSVLKKIFKNQSEMDATQQTETIYIPVCYAPEVAPDIISTALILNLDLYEMIDLHVKPVYRVYAMGFAPGFGYLGPLDRKLYLKRKSTPSINIPAGSVAIAANQTAIYPCKTPGGWHIIGKTTKQMIDTTEKFKTILKVGAKVRFFPVSLSEYISSGGKKC